jgi:formylglycine-generating enzyme required for sulfatase activity
LCRAGTTTSRYYGDSVELLPHYAWTWLNSGSRVMPPGRLLPNEIGLFDVLGNASEWCHDELAGPSAAGNPAPDLLAPDSIVSRDRDREPWRILRGGAFCHGPDRAISAFRDWHPAVDHRDYLGLRVVRTIRAQGP